MDHLTTLITAVAALVGAFGALLSGIVSVLSAWRTDSGFKRFTSPKKSLADTCLCHRYGVDGTFVGRVFSG